MFHQRLFVPKALSWKCHTSSHVYVSIIFAHEVEFKTAHAFSQLVQVQISEMEALMQLLQSEADREVRRVQEQMSELEVLSTSLGAAALILDLRLSMIQDDIV